MISLPWWALVLHPGRFTILTQGSYLATYTCACDVQVSQFDRVGVADHETAVASFTLLHYVGGVHMYMCAYP